MPIRISMSICIIATSWNSVTVWPTRPSSLGWAAIRCPSSRGQMFWNCR